MTRLACGIAAHTLLALCAALTAAVLGLSAASALAQSEPPPWLRDRVDAVVQMIGTTGDAGLEAFIDEAMAPGAVPDRDGFLAELRRIRSEVQGLRDSVAVEREPDGVRLVLSGGGETRELMVVLDRDGVHRLHLLDTAGPTEDARSPDAADDREGAIALHALALETSFSADLDELLERFEQDHFAAEYLRETTSSERRELLGRIRTAAQQAGGVGIAARDGRITLDLAGEQRYAVVFTVEADRPWGIATLSLERRDDAAPPMAISVDNLEDTIRRLEADGYSGILYLRRAGEVFLERPFGMANPELGIPVSRDTVFGIGSRPIDFTIASIFLLAQRGLLTLDDTVDRWFEEVPADKQSMTIRHLLTGRSGLVDFFHQPGDWDADLQWVDRRTAERRMLQSRLLFAPGQSHRHSHAAFVLLAAVVERASGQGYEEFLRENFFDPAGLTRTGMYGDRRDLSLEDFAVGQGPSRVGLPNIPPNWGPTSWLVMGSGGMYSSLPDLLKFYDLVRGSGMLEERYAEHFRAPVTQIDGSDRGFELLSIKGEGDTELYLMLNGFAGDEGFRQVVDGLRRMMERAQEDSGS